MIDIDRGAAWRRPERVSDVLLQEIGRVALAEQLLRARTAQRAQPSEPSWGPRSRRLLDSVRGVMAAASRSPRAGATIAVVRQGALVPVDQRYLERLTESIHRHVAVGDLLLVEEARARASA